jgi:hypothetical protein
MVIPLAIIVVNAHNDVRPEPLKRIKKQASFSRKGLFSRTDPGTSDAGAAHRR